MHLHIYIYIYTLAIRVIIERNNSPLFIRTLLSYRPSFSVDRIYHSLPQNLFLYRATLVLQKDLVRGGLFNPISKWKVK
jgi:hypothetical protein